MNDLSRREIVYCGECGMPPEYCSYGPDFESHCIPWLQKHHPDMYKELKQKQKDDKNDDGSKEEKALERPSEPWTMKERLTKFYEKYQPDKIDAVPGLLVKYEGKVDKLFAALVQKYGPEPEDPFYADSDSEDEIVNDIGEMSLSDKKKRRGAAAKKESKGETRVIIHKLKRNKKKAVTTVVGMDTVPGIKLKDVAKVFSKLFAGSSSVKDLPNGNKEIIVQGDHMDDAAALIVEKFNVPGECVFMDLDGEFVPFA
mmetsp:Transcript_8220/g.15478  ORF Transcript_8220/g.15478 Transcript_8220/m.15478 type:complete len:256 (-) Transcript_8220:3309-4076(-)